MLALTIIATAVAVISAIVALLSLGHARRSANAAEGSLTEARRSADAAEKSAGAAAITADADRAEDHRRRRPRLLVTVDALAPANGTEAIYRITNDGPVDLDSVIVNRPILGEVEGRIVHPVATTGSEYGDFAEVGPIELGSYGRFTLSLGVGAELPDFRVRIVSRVGDEEWSEVVLLDYPREPPSPRISTARYSQGLGT